MKENNCVRKVGKKSKMTVVPEWEKRKKIGKNLNKYFKSHWMLVENKSQKRNFMCNQAD